jgi:trans-2,3-dihydro-3-hydroxyanthranilate isomerase
MTERNYRFFTCDVFTQHRFGGNPLAVVLDAVGLSHDEMLAVTREFNFSETTFVLPARDPKHIARVRIFTPGGELPFAGHPTIGTAFVLAHMGRVPINVSDIVLEEAVGLVPVRIDRLGQKINRCTLTTAMLPAQGSAPPRRETLARMLSLLPIEVPDEAEWWSCGVPFMVIPLVSVDALARCRLDHAEWERTLADHTARMIYPVARADESTWRVRMFAPGAGVDEDPATGAAAAAFAGWLAKRKPHGDGTTRIMLKQGQEIGRPSELAIAFDQRDGQITAVRVGGASVMVTDGTLQL